MLNRKKRNLILEKLKRIYFYKTSYNYNFWKFLITSTILPLQIKIFILYYFTVFFNIISITRHKNICFSTSYKRSVNTFLKLNRMQAIQQISNRQLPGFSLAKW